MYLVPGGGVQLVLLDHGLYRDVPDTVRLNYCRLWKGIVLGDAAEVRRALMRASYLIFM